MRTRGFGAIAAGRQRSGGGGGPSSLLTGLIEFWELDEASGTRTGAHAGKTLTDVNTVMSAAGIGGVGTSALFVKANGEELTRASEADLQMGDIDFTIAGWVYLNSDSYTSVANKWESGNPEYILYYDEASDTFRLLLHSGFSVGNLAASTFGTVPMSTWCFVVGIHDSVSNIIKIGVNNGTFDTLSFSDGVQAASASFRIGSVDGSSHLGDGRVAKVGIWKRVLTSLEITALYNAGAGAAYPF